MNSNIPFQSFDTEQEAIDWMVEHLNNDDEYCIDNIRFAFNHDENAMLAYDAVRETGCCGFFDTEVMVNGCLAKIGCNYGH